jgi:hypothetical protein
LQHGTHMLLAQIQISARQMSVCARHLPHLYCKSATLPGNSSTVPMSSELLHTADTSCFTAPAQGLVLQSPLTLQGAGIFCWLPRPPHRRSAGFSALCRRRSSARSS